MPVTAPDAPTSAFSAIARLPVPQPTSSTDSPGTAAAISTVILRIAGALPNESSQDAAS